LYTTACGDTTFYVELFEDPTGEHDYRFAIDYKICLFDDKTVRKAL